MRESRFSDLVQEQRNFFNSGATRGFASRWQVLDKLHSLIREREKDIALSLASDLGKSPAEAYFTETGMVLAEISHCRKNLQAWMKPRRVPSPLILFPARSRIIPEPFGVCLVLAPWNYPFHLAMIPLVNALAAGNCVLLKPSAKAPATGRIVDEIISEACAPGLARVVFGDGRTGRELLRERFDFIFYTGGAQVGKEVMAAAAAGLTPVCLELGGKSPAIVLADADVRLAARRIAWGKTLNAGQTCVAPDYVLADEPVKEALVKALRAEFSAFPGPDALNNSQYCRIISKTALDRLDGLARGGAAFSRETMRMAPLVMDRAQWSDAVMQEEIFGPLLPVLPCSGPEDAVRLVRKQERPLACYVFSRDAEKAGAVLREIPCGGGCINDVAVQAGSHDIPFGGVGASGMGRYHGKAGFDLFSNLKGVVERGGWLDPPLRYPPFSDKVLPFVRRLLG